MSSLPTRRASEFWLPVSIALLIAFRGWFSAVLPMTGDEAYFVGWGEHPAGGYYDHPPMVGWWLTGLLAISRAEWVLRLPALLLPLVLAWGGWWLVRPYGVERARLAALLILLQPVNVWNVLITTDTPVVLFSWLSVLAYVAALRRVGSGLRGHTVLVWHALAGGLLGLAFLGKYFAALLGIAYLFHVLFVRRDRGRWSGFAVLLAAALPAPIYNLWWNSGHCWVNILFNFINRNTDTGLGWQNPSLYVGSLLYLATPWLILALWRQKTAVAAAVRDQCEAGASFWLMFVPLALFALMSLWRQVGLHWLLTFVPLLAVLAAIALTPPLLARLTRWSAALAALHVAAIVVVAQLPIQTWKDSGYFDGIVLTVHADQLIEKLQPYAADYLFATDGYSSAATLAYNANRRFAVFGEGSFHARQDDFMTDWRAQDGRKVLILRKSEPDRAKYGRFFAHVEFREFELYGARYYVVLGQGFLYAAYHEQVLTRIRDRFYRLPGWLPLRACEFCARYFPFVEKSVG
ncbi:MAG: glycosyltransferase family 39 protein [Propionivibrio sp.]